MKTLLEQDFDLGAALSGEKPVVTKPADKPVDKPADKPGDTIVDKPLDKDKNKVKKSAALRAMEMDLAAPGKIKYVDKLMINAVQYFKYLPGKMDYSDIDEYAVMDFMINHLRSRHGMYGSDMVRYCDLIYRFSNPSKYATLHKLIKKYPIEYKYFLTKNGKSGMSFERLLNSNLTFFTPFQNDSNDWAEYLDWEDKDTDLNIGKRFAKLSHSFAEFNPPYKIKISNRFTDLDINNLVLACYNVKAYGAPLEWLRKK